MTISKKSKFLKSAALAVAGIALSTSVSSCSMMQEKHACMFKGDKTKQEKGKCSSKSSCKGAKAEKASCSAAKTEKASCSADKEGKMKCSSKHSCKAS